MISTPTVAETSRIWPAWKSSTQDPFFVPCTHCSHAQHLRWSQPTWIDGKPATACTRARNAAGTIEERHKPELLAAGQWPAEHPEREHEVKGFHVNGLYTPIGLRDSWAKHAAAYERARGSASRLQVTVIDFVLHHGDTTRPNVWSKLDANLARELANEFRAHAYRSRAGRRMTLALSRRRHRAGLRPRQSERAQRRCAHRASP